MDIQDNSTDMVLNDPQEEFHYRIDKLRSIQKRVLDDLMVHLEKYREKQLLNELHKENE